jgi:GNAT superfamily N-acetyltransferase
MSGGLIRPFGRSDEAAVRRICLENGRLPAEKRPVDWLYQEYWTRYYTRNEREHTWIAEQDGAVTGYLTAAFDTERYRHAMKRRVLPILLLKSALTGALGEPRSREFLLRRIAMWAHLAPDPKGLLREYPAHLHLNLDEKSRGEGTGARLMEECLAQARREKIAGIHLETMPENERASRFFQRIGFSEIGRRYPFEFIDAAMKDRAVIVFGKKI